METSLEFIQSFRLKKTAKIIGIESVDGKLLNYLIDKGSENICVLEISIKALEKAINPLGKKVKK
jgi:hypothetical protein